MIRGGPLGRATGAGAGAAEAIWGTLESDAATLATGGSTRSALATGSLVALGADALALDATGEPGGVRDLTK
jgi:hypothetical protein